MFYKLIPGYENKVKENLLQRAQTYNMLDNILRVEIQHKPCKLEKWKEKKKLKRILGCNIYEMVMTDGAYQVNRSVPNVTGFVG